MSEETRRRLPVPFPTHMPSHDRGFQPGEIEAREERLDSALGFCGRLEVEPRAGCREEVGGRRGVGE